MKKKAFSLLLSLLLVLSMLALLGVVSFACWPHIYDDGVVTTEPTCGTTGVLTYTCTLCGDSFDVSLPASGEHVYDEPFITAEPTCGTPGVLTYICTVCGYVYNEPIPASGRTSLTAAILQPSRPTALRRAPVSTTRRTPKHR